MKRGRKKQRRERMIMIGSSLFVLTALTMTGIYVKDKNDSQNDGYVVDLSQLEIEETQELPKVEEPAIEEDSEEVSSTKVENRKSLWEEDYTTILDNDYDFWEETLENPVMKEEASSVIENDKAELKFSEEEQLLWPVVGNVLVNYSMESPVYFATLEQYKYNPAIVIQAKKGQNITSAAKGKVTKIEKTEELGNMITMELGNGYEIIYGQLENIQVKEGDVVDKGMYIADVASPTKYYSVEGENIYFALKKDGQPVNPMTKLQ